MMYRLISAISSDYGAYSYNRNSDYDLQPGFLGQSSSYFSNLYQSSIQALLLILVQQQLKDIFGQPGQTANQEQDQTEENDLLNTPGQHTILPYLPDTEQTEPMKYSPPPVVEEEPEQENTYAMILDSIWQLQQLLANHNMSQSFTSYNNDLTRNMQDQQIIQSVYMNGGCIVDTTERFFVAENADQTRYIINRS